MNRTTWLSIILLLAFCSGRGQEYSYTRYDISDGLAGPTVYCMAQDRDGFLWMGTEAGVSRFDGTNFHNYTTVDGLPDVEVLEMFTDSRGRVWMAPFSKSICYYFKGRFYNQANDPQLRRIRCRANIEHFAEDKDGNILLQERTVLHLLRPDGRVTDYDSIRGRPIRLCASICTSSSGHFLVQEDQQVFSFSEAAFTPLYTMHLLSALPVYFAMNESGMVYWSGPHTYTLRSFTTGKVVHFPFRDWTSRHVNFTALDDSLFYFNGISGTLEYNVHTGRTRKFLPGSQISRVFRDDRGNLWFTTLGHGIFRLNSNEFKTVRIRESGKEPVAIWSITEFGRRLLVGDDQNSISIFSLPDMSRGKAHVDADHMKNRILSIGKCPDGTFYVASDWGMGRHRPDLSPTIGPAPLLGSKYVFVKSPEELLVSCYWGVCEFDLVHFRIKDTLWKDRSTVVSCYKDTTFVGTLNGLYSLAPDHSVSYLGDRFPFLQKRISALATSSDGTLWIASYDAGVAGYKDGRLIATLSRRHGMTSDICKAVFLHGNDLWIGTDKGLNRVRLDQPGYPVSRYTSKDGLASDIVNTIFADDSSVYVGTPAGLSYFNAAKVDVSEDCRLYLLSVFNSGKERIADSGALALPYTDKHLRLEFAAISYRSVGGITYRYRLLGLDTLWRSTKENFLEYLTLPSGKYTLQLQAVNKFGNASNLLRMPFTVAAPWWQTIGFLLLVFAAAVSLTWFFVSLRIRQIRNRQKEKEKVSQRMLELEQMALRAQMNPHFIFNCLNSIQQYIFDQDVFAANKYIAGFARLIRATLQNSSKAFIPLADEIDFLSGYLSLEKIRFKEKMDYFIEVDPELDHAHCIIPPMLIQPYVENSMRHGLRHKTGGKGYIRLNFRRTGSRLSVIVEDNGIGRKGAAAFKTREHIEYQSKGMSLTADRIRMFNERHREPIRIEVIDLEDESGHPLGTRVVMDIPLLNYISENETI